MSAPSATIALPALIAASGFRFSPPSEKLSGVTLITPIKSGLFERRFHGSLEMLI
jgi:hypothetical protein